MHGAWGIAHGVDNLICNLDLKILRYALCAMLYSISFEPGHSDKKLAPETRFLLTPET
jgi:hypothetical protein